MNTRQNPPKGGMPPLFLEKRSYRMRRVMDVVRLLPVLGFVLWMVPVLWPHPDGPKGAMPLSSVVLYIFLIWFLLIGGTALAFVLRRRAPGDDPTEDAP